MRPDPPSLAALGRLAARTAAGGEPAPAPVLLADRPDGTVVRAGDTVAKAHAADTDPDALAVRLALAGDARLRSILLPPLSPGRAHSLPDGRAATTWPYGVPVDPDAPDAAPWAPSGAALAGLHSVPLRELESRYGTLPAMRGPAKAAAAVRRLPPTGRAGAAELDAAAATVRQAWSRVPPWCRGEEQPPPPRPATLCHGDFHLGQLVRYPPPFGRWHLIDVDDLGVGDPAWDLARPAAWYAAGLLPPAAWDSFLAAYRAGRPDCPADPWPWLDHPARALTVQSAAQAVTRAAQQRRALDEDEHALLAACSRIVELPTPVPP